MGQTICVNVTAGAAGSHQCRGGVGAGGCAGGPAAAAGQRQHSGPAGGAAGGVPAEESWSSLAWVKCHAQPPKSQEPKLPERSTAHQCWQVSHIYLQVLQQQQDQQAVQQVGAAGGLLNGAAGTGSLTSSGDLPAASSPTAAGAAAVAAGFAGVTTAGIPTVHVHTSVVLQQC
jgi:hypothetical protein